MPVASCVNIWSIIGMIIGGVGSFFLVKSSLLTAPKSIAYQSAAYHGSNPYLLKSMVGQKANSIIGFLLVFISSIFVITGIFVEGPCIDTLTAFWTSIVVLISVSILAFVAVKIITFVYIRKIRLYVFAEYISQYSQEYNDSTFPHDKAIDYATKLELIKDREIKLSGKELILSLLDECNEVEIKEKYLKYLEKTSGTKIRIKNE